MKKSLLVLLGAVAVSTSTAFAETITIGNKDYDVNFIIDRDLGPGVRYTRLRLPSYPLNVNLLRIDVSNPYNSVEVTQANDRLYGTESLVTAAKRQTKPGHIALAGANANFWCVSGQPPYSDQMVGVTYNGNLQNGKIITETNSKNDQYNGGLKHTGIVGIAENGKAYSNNNFSWAGWVTNDKIGSPEIYQCNKVVRDGEIGLYNSFYGTTRTFKCVNPYNSADGKLHFEVVNGDATEVYLTMNEGEKWSAGDPMAFTVKNVKTNSGNGSLGNYDLALVGRGENAATLAKLAAGDVVSVRYSWINSSGTEIKMKNLIGGNAQVMKNGEMTSYATSESYNSQVYSRTGYGVSEDKKTLYVIVIDKATDPVYGTSAGCSTTVMCQIAKHFGCTNMTNFDAGGSAEMFVGDRIINKTTETAPRAVANGMFAYSVAPEDNNVARLEFYDYELKSPIYATSTPRIIAFNQYGAVVDDDFKNVTLSCPVEAGTCEGASFTAGGQGMTTTLTAEYNGVTVTKPVTIVESQLALRVKPIVIDHNFEYPMEVTANIDGKEFTYNPASINWTVSNPEVADIDANGILRGFKNGTCEVTAKIGDFSDATTVTVQIPTEQYIGAMTYAAEGSSWKTSGTGTKNWKVTENADDKMSGLSLEYQVSSTRGTKVTLSRDAVLYSLPDAFEITLNPGKSKINSITLTLLPANADRGVAVVKDNLDLKANTDNTVRFDISDFADAKDLITYPITFKSLAFALGDAVASGYKIDVPKMAAYYEHFKSLGTGVESVVVEDDDANCAPAYFDLQGRKVNADELVPGVYVVRQGNKTYKKIIK